MEACAGEGLDLGVLLGSGGGAAPVLGHAALQVPQLLLLLACLGLEGRDLVRGQGHQQGRRLPQVHICSAACVAVILAAASTACAGPRTASTVRVSAPLPHTGERPLPPEHGHPRQSHCAETHASAALHAWLHITGIYELNY